MKQTILSKRTILWSFLKRIIFYNRPLYHIFATKDCGNSLVGRGGRCRFCALIMYNTFGEPTDQCGEVKGLSKSLKMVGENGEQSISPDMGDHCNKLQQRLGAIHI